MKIGTDRNPISFGDFAREKRKTIVQSQNGSVSVKSEIKILALFRESHGLLRFDETEEADVEVIGQITDLDIANAILTNEAPDVEMPEFPQDDKNATKGEPDT